MSQTIVLSPLAMFFGDYLDGEVDGLVGEDSMATSWLGYEMINLSVNGPRKTAIVPCFYY